MTRRQHLKENLRLAIPVMLTNLGHVLMGFTDNIVVGHIDATSLAAAGLALVVFNVLLLFGVGVSYAITPLVAEAHGEHDPAKVVEVVRHGLVINVLNSLVLILIVFFGKNLLYKIDQPAEVVAKSIPFLDIIAFSLLPVMIFQTFKQFAEGLGKTRVAMIVMLGANVVNLALNFVLVFGHLGFKPLGLEGSGWATFFSRAFMAIAIAVYVYYSPAFKTFRGVFTLQNLRGVMFRKVLNLGVPSGVQFIFEVAAFDFSLVMMGWLGTATLAAHQIAINLATISYMTTAGLAAAATIRVGYHLGAHEYKEMRESALSLLTLALVVMAAWALLFIGGRNWLPHLYVNDPEVIAIAGSLLVIAGLFQLADGAQVVCASALRGLQDVKIPSVFILIAYWIIGLPLGYLLTFKAGFGATGVWWGLLIGLVLTASAMLVRLNRLLRRAEVSKKAHELADHS